MLDEDGQAVADRPDDQTGLDAHPPFRTPLLGLPATGSAVLEELKPAQQEQCRTARSQALPG